MHRQNQAKTFTIVSTIRRLLRVIGLMDGTPFSVKNSRRRRSQTRASVERVQDRLPAFEPLGSLS
jgi:hypothetical protein